MVLFWSVMYFTGCRVCLLRPVCMEWFCKIVCWENLNIYAAIANPWGEVPRWWMERSINTLRLQEGEIPGLLPSWTGCHVLFIEIPSRLAVGLILLELTEETFFWGSGLVSLEKGIWKILKGGIQLRTLMSTDRCERSLALYAAAIPLVLESTLLKKGMLRLLSLYSSVH